MAGNTHGCVVDRETRNASPAATAYIASTYFEQGTALLRRGSYARGGDLPAGGRPDLAAITRAPGTTWAPPSGSKAGSWRPRTYYRRALAEAPDDFGVLNNLGQRPVGAEPARRGGRLLQAGAGDSSPIRPRPR